MREVLLTHLQHKREVVLALLAQEPSASN